MNECSEMKQTSADFTCSGSREQWTLCREHVNRKNTVHAWSALLTSRLSESSVLTKRDMQNMQSGGARGLELRTSAQVQPKVAPIAQKVKVNGIEVEVVE